MLKKHFLFSLFSCAFGILLAHNIIPHHHHDSNHDLAEQQQFDQEHDGTHENGLNHLFAHFVHSGDEITFTASRNFADSFAKQLALNPAVLSGNFSWILFSAPPLLFSAPEQEVIYTSPHSLSSGLRAPPNV